MLLPSLIVCFVKLTYRYIALCSSLVFASPLVSAETVPERAHKIITVDHPGPAVLLFLQGTWLSNKNTDQNQTIEVWSGSEGHDAVRIREYKTGSGHLTGCEVTVFKGRRYGTVGKIDRLGTTPAETSPSESTGLLDYDSDWATFKQGDTIQTYELHGENSLSITETSPSKKIEQESFVRQVIPFTSGPDIRMPKTVPLNDSPK